MEDNFEKEQNPKTVAVDFPTYKRLAQIKLDKNLSSMNEVVEQLLNNQKDILK